MKIGIIGTYPPPYGGRSVHIQRFIEFITRNLPWEITVFDSTKNRRIELNEKVIVLPFKGKFKMVLCLIGMIFSVDVIHYHGSDWLLRVVVSFLVFFRKKVIISIHSNISLRRDYKSGNWLKKWLMRYALNRDSFIIASSSEIQKFLLSLGVNAKKIVAIPSFIPPFERKKDYELVPQDIWDFTNSHEPVIGANAFQIVIRDGIDVYGLDLLVELIDRLRNTYPSIGLIFLLPAIGDFKYFNEINKKIGEKDLRKHILIVTEPVPAYPIWKNIDLFIRSTTTDTTAISLWEALWYGKPVIASDCVQRPKGVVLFKNRDITSLAKKTKIALANYGRRGRISINYEYANDIIKVYQRMLKVNSIKRENIEVE